MWLHKNFKFFCYRLQHDNQYHFLKGAKAEGDNSQKKKYKQVICMWKKTFNPAHNHIFHPSNGFLKILMIFNAENEKCASHVAGGGANCYSSSRNMYISFFLLWIKNYKILYTRFFTHKERGFKRRERRCRLREISTMYQPSAKCGLLFGSILEKVVRTKE